MSCITSGFILVMKILHLSTGDISGGAFRGSYWLHRGLLESGMDSVLLVKDKVSDDSTVLRTPESRYLHKVDKVKNLLNYVPLSFYKNGDSVLFSPSWTSSSGILNAVQRLKPDIINLHWVNGGFVKPEILRDFHTPIVWTLRDMWSFTGGCHYSGSCNAYVQGCGSCPLLHSRKENDLSRKVWQRKKKSWKNIDIRLVAISKWLANCAESSALFNGLKVEVIPNALDEKKFRPLPKSIARDLLKLPLNKKLILFGAINATSNSLKGFQYLIPALKKISISDLAENTEVVIFGSSKPEQEVDLGLKVTYLGKLHDDVALNLVYSAADVMIVPSVQEAFGKTAIEAMACATPVVSFDTTGLKDIVKHEYNGYRAKCFDIDDLAYGIQWVLEDPVRHDMLCRHSLLRFLDKFTIDQQVDSYTKLYEEILSN